MSDAGKSDRKRRAVEQSTGFKRCQSVVKRSGSCCLYFLFLFLLAWWLDHCCLV
jgi:hypothetical protein